MLRRLRLVVLVVTTVTLLGVAGGLTRAPQHRAEARLLVGSVDAESRAVPGFASAVEDLAAVYARVVPTDAIIEPVAQRLGLTSADVRHAVRASPIPSASIIRIESTGSDAARTMAIANEVAAELTGYVDRLNDVDPTTQPSYADYRLAAESLVDKQLIETAARKRYDALAASRTAEAGAIEAARTALVEASSATLQAQLRAQSMASAYANATRGLAERSSVTPLGDALPLGNDRTTVLIVLVLLAGTTGVVLAFGLAMGLENRAFVRQLRQRPPLRR